MNYGTLGRAIHGERLAAAPNRVMEILRRRAEEAVEAGGGDVPPAPRSLVEAAERVSALSGADNEQAEALYGLACVHLSLMAHSAVATAFGWYGDSL